jgi:SPP1 gp7 family putative phage head morphogenesis protein
MDALIDKMIRNVYKGSTDVDMEVMSAYAKKMFQGVVKGYGESLTSVDYDTPDGEMLRRLQQNVWQFSGAKTYTQLRELSDALLDDEGKARSRRDFIDVASKIVDTQKRYLSAEYELAIAGAQMASKWADIGDDDMLEFDAVMDNQTTSLCAGLNGTTLPASHSFWNINYPPNHFGCRSTVRVVYGKSSTPAGDIPRADIPPMFKTNLAKQGLIYPPDHAFFKNTPESVLEEAIKYLPYDSQFVKVNGQKAREHILLDKTGKDFPSVLQSSRKLSQHYTKIEILPKFDNIDLKIRKILLPDGKGNKWPDLRLDGILADVKSPDTPTTINAFEKSVRRAKNQGDIAVIYLQDDSIDSEINRLGNKLIKRYKESGDLKRIWVIKPNGEMKDFK